MTTLFTMGEQTMSRLFTENKMQMSLKHVKNMLNPLMVREMLIEIQNFSYQIDR